MVQVFEFNKKDTKHQRIASFKDFNFGDIMTGKTVKVQANKREIELKFSGYDSDKNYSFLEYIAGGCEIDLHVAINLNYTNGI